MVRFEVYVGATASSDCAARVPECCVHSTMSFCWLFSLWTGAHTISMSSLRATGAETGTKHQGFPCDSSLLIAITRCCFHCRSHSLSLVSKPSVLKSYSVAVHCRPPWPLRSSLSTEFVLPYRCVRVAVQAAINSAPSRVPQHRKFCPLSTPNCRFIVQLNMCIRLVAIFDRIDFRMRERYAANLETFNFHRISDVDHYRFCHLTSPFAAGLQE